MNSNGGVPTSPSKQPKMPQVKEEQEEINGKENANNNMTNGNTNGEAAAATVEESNNVVEANTLNCTDAVPPMVAAAE